jgi:ribosomal-protein-alanine N-acetyltransferase
MESLLIRKATVEDAVHLSQLINEDAILRHDLNVGEQPNPVSIDYFEQLTAWCRDPNGETHVIVADGKAVGAISLNHIDTANATAQVGFWIGSRHRRRGYCTRAFALIMEQARQQGITTLRATIDAENIAARRIWDRAGAGAFPTSDGRMFCELRLSRQPVATSCG